MRGMSAGPDRSTPPPLPARAGDIAAAQRARERLHEEIERVRLGVEEMLAEQGGGDDAIRRELAELREETRRYVKRRVRKSEKRLERSMREIDERTGKLERRLDHIRAGSPVRRVADTHQHGGDARRPTPRGPGHRRSPDR